MKYKVIPFVSNTSNQGNPKEVSQKIETLLNQGADKDWEFYQIQELTTFVAGSSGCFGIGGSPGTTTSLSVLIFKKKEVEQ